MNDKIIFLAKALDRIAAAIVFKEQLFVFTTPTILANKLVSSVPAGVAARLCLQGAA